MTSNVVLILIAVAVALLMQPAMKRPIRSLRTVVEALVLTAVLLVVQLVLQIGALSYRCEDYFCGWMR